MFSLRRSQDQTPASGLASQPLLTGGGDGHRDGNRDGNRDGRRLGGTGGRSGGGGEPPQRRGGGGGGSSSVSKFEMWQQGTPHFRNPPLLPLHAGAGLMDMAGYGPGIFSGGVAGGGLGGGGGKRVHLAQRRGFGPQHGYSRNRRDGRSGGGGGGGGPDGNRGSRDSVEGGSGDGARLDSKGGAPRFQRNH